MPAISLRLNGKDVTIEVEARTLLVELLRERLGLTGTHVGCDTSQCGACVVHVDGRSAPGQAYAEIVRSPVAHARIRATRTDGARNAPGVLAVLTGADLAADKLGNIPTGWLIRNKDGTPMVEPPHPALALDRVRHVGDPVVLVVADSKHHAREAAAAVEVDYEELPAVATVGQAIRPGARVMTAVTPRRRSTARRRTARPAPRRTPPACR